MAEIVFPWIKPRPFNPNGLDNLILNKEEYHV